MNIHEKMAESAIQIEMTENINIERELGAIIPAISIMQKCQNSNQNVNCVRKFREEKYLRVR